MLSSWAEGVREQEVGKSRPSVAPGRRGSATA